MPFSRFLFLAAIFAAAAASLTPPPTSNNRPIVGIITQPIDGASTWRQFGSSFINADYVKWLAAGGARVVPIRYDGTDEELFQTLSSVNGLLFPGGGDILNHTKYYSSGQKLFAAALKSNDQGNYFPVWGTCLGFEELSMLVSGLDQDRVLDHFAAENIDLPLVLTDYAKQSRIFSGLTEADRATVLDYLANNGVTDNQHHWGLPYSTFFANQNLFNFFNLISSNVDRNGKAFISSLEGKNYPVYGVQWHPERSMFEWDPTEAADHSDMTIDVMAYIARFFVNETRRNLQHYPSYTAEINAVIENFPLKVMASGSQYYFFGPAVLPMDTTSSTVSGSVWLTAGLILAAFVVGAAVMGAVWYFRARSTSSPELYNRILE
eukprot:gnl/Spiro4/9612_TR5101_c1_g1_i1.p1 gnl/Spiro4/9612_TR5101_c1_g1~~gnl/Spiro4/9612_TR5101_c1_g1_i1.p1  ORF type:complete len:388 (+),score=106.95 gnl/Spiro4/9612_TR5101_c1_g1_i1:31-1164(+)